MYREYTPPSIHYFNGCSAAVCALYYVRTSCMHVGGRYRVENDVIKKDNKL